MTATKLSIRKGSFEASRKKIREKQRAHVRQVLERVGALTVEFLQSFTGETKGRGRRMHPGRWADRSGNLSRGYGFQVLEDADSFILRIQNTAKHAHLIEARDGLFVVRGAAEPGGPVQEALRRAVRELGLDWEVR